MKLTAYDSAGGVELNGAEVLRETDEDSDNVVRAGNELEGMVLVRVALVEMVPAGRVEMGLACVVLLLAWMVLGETVLGETVLGEMVLGALVPKPLFDEEDVRGIEPVD